MNSACKGGDGMMDYNEVAISQEKGSMYQGGGETRGSTAQNYIGDRGRELGKPLLRIFQIIAIGVRVVKSLVWQEFVYQV